MSSRITVLTIAVAVLACIFASSTWAVYDCNPSGAGVFYDPNVSKDVLYLPCNDDDDNNNVVVDWSDSGPSIDNDLHAITFTTSDGLSHNISFFSYGSTVKWYLNADKTGEISGMYNSTASSWTFYLEGIDPSDYTELETFGLGCSLKRIRIYPCRLDLDLGLYTINDSSDGFDTTEYHQMLYLPQGMGNQLMKVGVLFRDTPLSIQNGNEVRDWQTGTISLSGQSTALGDCSVTLSTNGYQTTSTDPAERQNEVATQQPLSWIADNLPSEIYFRTDESRSTICGSTWFKVTAKLPSGWNSTTLEYVFDGYEIADEVTGTAVGMESTDDNSVYSSTGTPLLSENSCSSSSFWSMYTSTYGWPVDISHTGRILDAHTALIDLCGSGADFFHMPFREASLGFYARSVGTEALAYGMRSEVVLLTPIGETTSPYNPNGNDYVYIDQGTGHISATYTNESFTWASSNNEGKDFYDPNISAHVLFIPDNVNDNSGSAGVCDVNESGADPDIYPLKVTVLNACDFHIAWSNGGSVQFWADSSRTTPITQNPIQVTNASQYTMYVEGIAPGKETLTVSAQGKISSTLNIVSCDLDFDAGIYLTQNSSDGYDTTEAGHWMTATSWCPMGVLLPASPRLVNGVLDYAWQDAQCTFAPYDSNDPILTPLADAPVEIQGNYLTDSTDVSVRSNEYLTSAPINCTVPTIPSELYVRGVDEVTDNLGTSTFTANVDLPRAWDAVNQRYLYDGLEASDVVKGTSIGAVVVDDASVVDPNGASLSASFKVSTMPSGRNVPFNIMGWPRVNEIANCAYLTRDGARTSPAYFRDGVYYANGSLPWDATTPQVVPVNLGFDATQYGTVYDAPYKIYSEVWWGQPSGVVITPYGTGSVILDQGTGHVDIDFHR